MVPGPAILMVWKLEFWLSVHVFKISFDFSYCVLHSRPPQLPLSLKGG